MNMIAGNELADWLRDRQAQRNTGETMEEVARRLRRLPCLERLHDVPSDRRSSERIAGYGRYADNRFGKKSL